VLKVPPSHKHTHTQGWVSTCCFASPMQGGCIEGFLFQFCQVDGLVIIHPTRGMSQIWLVVRQGSLNFLESCLLLATYIETHCLAISGDFLFLFLKIWRLFCIFSKKILIRISTGLLCFCSHSTKISPK
jgi:hypothetical protein